MEQWEALMKVYPTNEDLRSYNKALQTVGVVLKEDLATFETDYIIETLLQSPVNLFHTVSSKRNDDTWLKSIGDSFKLLSEVIKKYGDCIDHFYEDIVNLCQLSYDDRTRKQSLHCLKVLAEQFPLPSHDVERLVHSMQELPTCVAPMHILVGTICEHHPELVSDQINNIWRTCLNMLDSNKNTDTISSAILQCILGILKHFGCDLPTSELFAFYDKMTSGFLNVPRCESVIFSILEHHSKLFGERLSKDARTRTYLWTVMQDKNASNPLRSVYEALCAVVEKNRMQSIILEILPHTKSYRNQVKYTALRILTHMKTKYKVDIQIPMDVDIHSLEFELRNQNVTYDVAEAVSWCIESNLQNSEKLIQTAMLFYENLPSSRRKEIVVNGILKAELEIRTSAIIFLTSESCQDLHPHLRLWTDLFDTEGGKNLLVMENSRAVFEDFMAYTVFVIDNFLDDQVERMPEKLLSLLALTSHVLQQQCPEHYTSDHCAILLPLLTQLIKQYGCDASNMAAVRSACLHLNEEHHDLAREVYKMIQVDRCKDEALLCESCLTLIDAPPDCVENMDGVFMALQIIFSSNDVEAKTLSKALQKLESLIISENYDETQYSRTIELIEKLRTRKDMSGKDGRVLHRDIVLFLGKYSNRREDNNNNSLNNIRFLKPKDHLYLNVANLYEGTSFKINLQRILELAILHEEPNTLQVLLSIICSNLPSRKEHESMLCSVVHALCRSHARGNNVNALHIQDAVMMCASVNSVRDILIYISEESSPGVRKMLSDALEDVLVRDPGSELTENLVTDIAERVLLMLTSSSSTTKRAGLDIMETLTTALKKNNSLSEKLLPIILAHISKSNELDCQIAFEFASATFLEKMELFSSQDLDDLVKNLLEIVLDQDGGELKSNMEDIDVKLYKNKAKMVLCFVKKVFDKQKDNYSNFFHTINGTYDEMYNKIVTTNTENRNTIFLKHLYVLGEVRNVFNLDLDDSRNLLSYKNCMVVNETLCMKILYENHFCMVPVLKFLEEYAEVLLELQYQKTLEFVAEIIKNITPECIKLECKNIKSCLSVYNKLLKKPPAIFLTSFEIFCQKLPLNQITVNLSKDLLTDEHALAVFSLKTMIQALNLTDMSIITLAEANSIQKWSVMLLKLFSSGYITKYLKSKMAYLTDILTVSVKFCAVSDVKKLILEGHEIHGVSNEKVGLKFCRYFIHVFYEVLMKKPYLLLEREMETCCVLINDITKYVLKKKFSDENHENLLDLVVRLWSTYEARTTFIEKQYLLMELNNLPLKLDRESSPLQWAVNVICGEGSCDEKMMLIGALPGGEEYGDAYRSFASSLPIRLSELRGSGHACFRALLDALVVNQNLTLLEIVVKLSAGDDTKGWWDEAIESSMASIAPHADQAVYDFVYTFSFEGLSTNVCERVMLPLLRYSKPSICEKFFSTRIESLLTKITVGVEPSLHIKYRKHLADYTRAYSILQVAFEKLSPSVMEAPTSLLYAGVTRATPWHLVRQASRLCASMRDRPCPNNADDTLKETYRLFQCANYKCLTAAICIRKPGPEFYKCLFNVQVWDKLVNQDQVYELKLRSPWNQRTKRQSVSVNVESASRSLTVTSQSATLRTRMFLRTLSENPLQYDLIDQPEEEIVITQDLQLEESELNSHECTATLTALLCHARGLDHIGDEWLEILAQGLRESKVQIKWLLAQAICNCKEDLKWHASALRPALLHLISSTARTHDDKKLLNQLHVDVLQTILSWKDPDPAPSTELNASVEILVSTCLENRHRLNIFRHLVDLLAKLLDVYGGVLTVSWKVIEPYVNDTTEASKTIQILQKISKAKIEIPELLPTLISKLGNSSYQLSTIAELFGLAMSNCQNESVRREALSKFRRVLEGLKRRNVSEYVRMVYYAQKGFSRCCDESIFKVITELVANIPGADKSKCLQIISTYISTDKSNYIQDMFDIVDLSELVQAETSAEAMYVVSNGLKMMEDGLKRRLVIQISGYCGHSLVKVRKAAFEVIVKAFEDLLPERPTSQAKRLKPSSTRILDVMDSNDVYARTIVASLGIGCTDSDENIAGMVKEMVANNLCQHDLAVRFAECYLIAIYLPSLMNTNEIHHPDSVSALLEMLFSGIRKHERFQKIKLREEPLDIREPSTDVPKLLTMSRTYQGTFRGHTPLTGRLRNLRRQEAAKTTIDVQITIDSILDVLLNFAKINSEASLTLCVQTLVTLLKNDTSDTGSVLARMITNVPNAAVVEIARVLVEHGVNIDSYKEAIEQFKQSTRGTEAEQSVNLLHQDILLRSSDRELFVLGRDEVDADVAMETPQFSIEGLTAVFGKLSNWDNLTVQQKNRIQNSGLPPLWTSREDFKIHLDDYKGTTNSWFTKMASAYNHKEKRNIIKWLREIDQWPRKRFDVSAITEAIQWQSKEIDVNQKFPSRMQREDCLAEWAARFMIRTACLNNLETDSGSERTNSHLSRSYELKWCEAANERGLSRFVLDCVTRNNTDLYETEVMSWQLQHLRALRATALHQNDTDKLKKILTNAEKYASKYSTPEVFIEMNSLMLQLNNDLKSLSKDKLQTTLRGVQQHIHNTNQRRSQTDIVNLTAIYELAITYYDDICVETCDVKEKHIILNSMLEVIDRSRNLNLPKWDFFTIVILNKLDQHEELLPDDLARKLLDCISIKNQSNDGCIEQLKSHRNIFPARLLTEYSFMLEREDDKLNKYKKCFQLIGDPEYSLLQYCELLKSLRDNDAAQWSQIFGRIKAKIFENQFAGSDYQLLTRYKSSLYEISDFESTDTFKSKSQKIIRDIIIELKRKTPQSMLRLSQLCPTLSPTQSHRWASVERAPLNKLLGLREGIFVVRFDEQVPLFTDSIRRPAVMRVLLSNGTTRKYLHKSGEPLRIDACAQRVVDACRHLCMTPVIGYNVTPLSDDCGLIEYLEDFERLRSWISTSCDLDAIRTSITHNDSSLILSPPRALIQQYTQICRRVPVYALRSAIQARSTCVRDCVSGMMQLQRTLPAVALLSWILGLGDRHLENILYCNKDGGGLCCIDWGNMLQYGTGELAPARLTRNLLAACDVQVLESNLQNLLNSLRESKNIFLAAVKITFKWMREDFHEKYAYIESILHGSASCYEVTRSSLQSSNKMYKEKYIELLDRVFEGKMKERYSVQEQVSNLLIQCTDPQILAVTRSGWEPWV